MNKITSQKYGFSPDFVEEKKTLSDEKFHEIYDFHRLVKVRKFAERYERSDIKSDRQFRKKLRSPLEISEKVIVLAERLKKNDAPGTLYKSTTENMPFLNREQIFIVRKVLPKINSYDYWISKTEEGLIIDKTFLRQELFALKNQFI